MAVLSVENIITAEGNWNRRSVSVWASWTVMTEPSIKLLGIVLYYNRREHVELPETHCSSKDKMTLWHFPGSQLSLVSLSES